MTGNHQVAGGGSAVTAESNVLMSSEESSTYPDNDDLELGLGLSLGRRRGKEKEKEMDPASVGGAWDHYAKILTAEDFPSVVSTKTSSSSSSSSSASVSKANNSGSFGTKRTAEPPSSPPGRPSVSQVVGWPPVRTYRANSLVNHAKSPITEDFLSAVDECKSKNDVTNTTNHSGSGSINDVTEKEKGLIKNSLFKKVNMDGVPIGRKVDLNAQGSYEALAQALDDMFKLHTMTGTRCLRQPVKLLDGSSDFMLTYEDKDRDWMLVGDVPWELFVNSVRRLRIMRTAEANGLGSRESNKKH